MHADQQVGTPNGLDTAYCPLSFWYVHPYRALMKTVRKGLRENEIQKDTYERLTCVPCERALKTKNDPSELGSVRFCPDCGAEWRALR